VLRLGPKGDYDSSWQFAAGVAASTAIVGAACFAGTLFVRILFPVYDLFGVLLPAFAMAVVAAQVLERWTRP